MQTTNNRVTGNQCVGNGEKTNQERQQLVKIDTLLKTVKDFDATSVSSSWSPDEGGQTIVALNKLHGALIKKAAEIKQYVRTLTVEELNELDGFSGSGTQPIQ